MKLGYFPSPPDKVGDGHPTMLLSAAPVDLPDDAAVECSPVLVQDDEDCTGNAVMGAAQTLMGKLPNGDWHPLGSRRFVFAVSRELAKIPLSQHDGSFIWSSMDCLKEVGFPREVDWPYTQDRLTIPPDPEAYRMALDQKVVDGVFRMQTTGDALALDVIKSIAAGAVVPGGFMIDRAFENATPGYVWGGPSGIIGGHAVYARAFRGVRNGNDISNAEIRFRSSWGADFGDAGDIWIAARALVGMLDAWRMTIKIPARFSSEAA